MDWKGVTENHYLVEQSRECFLNFFVVTVNSFILPNACTCTAMHFCFIRNVSWISESRSMRSYQIESDIDLYSPALDDFIGSFSISNIKVFDKLLEIYFGSR